LAFPIPALVALPLLLPLAWQFSHRIKYFGGVFPADLVEMFNMVRVMGVLRAGGDNRYCLLTDTIAMWGLGIPLYCIDVFSGGLFFHDHL
jgi:hypothetical protein